MSSVIGYTVYANYPRIFVRDTDKTAITTRTNTAGSWQDYWDNTLTSYATTLASQADSYVAAVNDDSYSRFMVLGLYGWIESNTAAHNKLLSAAKYLAQTTSIWDSWTGRRYQVLALSYAYNFLRTGVITFSEADRKIIGDALITMADGGTNDTTEFLDGHSAGNYMTQFIAGATLYGESGSGYNYTATATTRMDDALGFWYGDTSGDTCHMDTWRYFCSDGGHWMGGWYPHISIWKLAFMTLAVDSALTSITLNGDSYDPISDESFIGLLGEYVLNTWMRGDNDYYSIMDTSRISSPWVHNQTRHGLTYLIANGGTYRKPLRWLKDTLQAVEVCSAYSQIHDVLFYDPSDTDNASVHPKDHTPVISTTYYANPPGHFTYRNTWDHTNACVIKIDCPERYFLGHTHLTCGGIQIGVKDDMVLLNTGIYRTSDAAADYNGTHHHFYHQQSIAHSGVPLCDDGSYIHYNYNYTGSWSAYPTALGGQVWKMNGAAKDTYNVSSLRFDGGGEAWHRATMTMPESTDSYDFVVCDVRPAYVRDYTEIDSSTERVRACKIKYLVIKGEGVWPIVLRIHQMTSRLTSMTKRDQWHAYGQWTLSYPGNGAYRGTAQGYRGTGKVLIDLYNYADFLTQQVGGGALNAAGYAAQQFYYNGTNYPPSNTCPSRYLPDLGRYRLEHRALIGRSSENFVQLIMPMGVYDSPPAYTWINEANWFGIRFSSSAHEYRISKTTDAVSVTADSTAPNAPTGLGATVGDTQIVLAWTPNVESDMASYKVYYREKV